MFIYNYFTTAGCIGDADPGDFSYSEIIETDTERDVNFIIDDGRVLSAGIAPGTADLEFVIQIKALPKSPVLNVIGRPNLTLNEAGEKVFDIKAIVNGDTILDSFNIPITITYEYGDEDVVGLDESTLWFYHYSDGEWIALDDCVLDTDENQISCTTPSFSIFGLFGSEPVVETADAGISTGIRFGCKDKKALNYQYFSSHKQELCKYNSPNQTLQKTVNQDILLKSDSGDTIPPKDGVSILGVENLPLLVRDLKYGMKGDDVRALQTLLIKEGYVIPAGATSYFGLQTQYALDAYQVDHNIAPRGGYFGPITRAKIKSLGLSGLWW